MKKVVITITAAIFALGLTSAGLAQTTQTPAKPEVKKESTAVQTPAAKPEAAKPEAPKANRISLELIKPEAKHVCVAGSFNEWKPERTPLVARGHGRWAGCS